MLPDPLHPVVVHIPMALAALMPLLAMLAGLAIHKNWLPARSWAAIVLLQAILLGSGWLALETGEQEEERVEHTVSERPIEAHEEAAERFLLVAGLGLVLTAAGMIPGRRGVAGRVVATVATLAVLGAGISVGHAGGELVYKYGAASARSKTASEPRAHTDGHHSARSVGPVDQPG